MKLFLHTLMEKTNVKTKKRNKRLHIFNIW
jgi:hypothetical protein